MLKKALVSALIFTCSYSNADENIKNCNKQSHRVFSHELLIGGDVCLPKNIKRVVALDIGAAELSILTGHEIVGAPGWLLSEMSAYHPNWRDKYASIEDVGIPANLEKIVKLKPDVILAIGKSEYTHKLIDIKKARNIAPVIAADAVVYRDWKKSMQFWSQALGQKGLYQQMKANYDVRIKELKSNLQNKWRISSKDVDQKIAATKVSVASITAHGMYMWLPLTPPSAILRDIGFSRTDSQNLSVKEAVDKYKNDSYAKINKEYLSLLDGDVLFAFAYASHKPSVVEKERKVWDSLQNKQLWKRLNVAKNEQAHYVSNSWFRSSTYLLANRVLDDISMSMTNKSLSYDVMKGIKSDK